MAASAPMVAQTSWIGGSSVKWGQQSNWTAGVPGSNTDVIIGDASFTGPFHPELNVNGKCKNLTIGNGASVCTLSIAKNLTMTGTMTIGSNGVILANTKSKIITLKGNWINNGTYNATTNKAEVTFSGGNESITGNTTFEILNINSGSKLTLNDNITVNNELNVSGSINPGLANSISGTGDVTVESSGILYVYSEYFTGNYPISGTISLDRNTTVDYASDTINQFVSNAMTYARLRISGGTIKELTGNLPDLRSDKNYTGRIYIDAGTLDLKTYTANRGTNKDGGDFILSPGTTLKIGGTNGFPQNYETVSLSSTSTVEYYGNNQTVDNYEYGNLTLSATTGSVVKTMPVTPLTIYGNLTSTQGTGTDLSFTAGSSISVSKNVNIGTGTTFDGATFSHTFKNDWINNGTFTGSTSTCTFSGAASNLSGSGNHNFYHLQFSATDVTADSAATINVSGDLSTLTIGSFRHSDGGELVMTGSSTSIEGDGFDLYDLTISGTVSTAENITIRGNLDCSGSFSASDGTVRMTGIAKSISGSGPITFDKLNIRGQITTDRDFTINDNFSVFVAGSITASAGTATFAGFTTLTGSADLYDVTINATKTLQLGVTSVLGVAGTLTKNGTLDVTTKQPNTVEYNSSGNQSILSTDYCNLTLATGGQKTFQGNTTIYRHMTINSGVTCDAASHIISIYEDWINNGTFSAGTSDVQFISSTISNLFGTTTFNDLTINKTDNDVLIFLNANIAASNIILTNGTVDTQEDTITTTGGRSGNGYIYGTIARNHTFVNGTAYAFEGPDNLITFTSPSGSLTSVIVTCLPQEVTDFDPNKESIAREYTIAIPNGTYTNATMRLHYLDNELNAFEEPFLAFYKHNTGIVWDSIGFTSRDTTANWVEYAALTTISGRFTLSGVRRVLEWIGTTSTDWHDQSNWNTISGSDMSNRVPIYRDAVRIGTVTFTYQPATSTAQTIAAIRFGSEKAVTLTLGDTLTILASVRGTWDTARTHTISVGNEVLSIRTNLDLSDGTAGNDLTIDAAGGDIYVQNNILHRGGGTFNFTGSADLFVRRNYLYTSGTFNAGTSTVTYSGPLAQIIAPVTYYNVSFTKSNETAVISAPAIILSNLTTSVDGRVWIRDTLSINGNVTIGASTELANSNTQMIIGGNWTINGTFEAGDGSVYFNGTNKQTVSACTFNDLVIDKSSDTLQLMGDVLVTADLQLRDGLLNLDTFSIDRTSNGGTFSMDSATTMLIGGTSNFPGLFAANTIDANSTVTYNGTIAQTVRQSIAYGHLQFANGSPNAKTVNGDIEVRGDFLINAGAILAADSVNIALNGNLTNNGTVNPGESTFTLEGASKTVTGPITVNNLTVSGSYTVSSGTTTMEGNLNVLTTGSLNFGTNTAILDGDLTNRGSLISAGTATFTGTRVQIIQLINAISSTSTGVVNFNGTIAPVISSTSSPTFATVNINNTDTAGIRPSVPWYVYFGFNVANGSTFHGGALDHTFFGNFTNNGIVTSSGTLKFSPGAPFSASATIQLDGNTFYSSGNVNFSGTAPITISHQNPNFYNVIISNVHSSGVSAPGSWDISNELQILENATFRGGSGNHHTISGVLLNNGTLDGDSSIIEFDSIGTSIEGIGTTTFFDLQVDTAADLTLNSSIEVEQDLTNNGTFNAIGRKVTFVGDGASIINGFSGSITFGDLEMNKNGAYITTLGIPATVEESLTLTQGLINTDATNLLILTDDATSTSGSLFSFVDGPMRKVGNDAFVFPLGDDTYWARLGISAPSDTADAFTAQYKLDPYTDTTTMAGSPTPVLNNVSQVEHWILDRTAGSSNVTVELFWENAPYSGIDDYSSDLVVARWNGSAWENAGQSAIVGSSPGSITSNTISSFSPFTFGSLSAGVNVLPVELLYFKAFRIGETVQLAWETSVEIENDYFEVERSLDARTWITIDRLEGLGNSAFGKYYTTLDSEPPTGVVYYRLKQVDFDGSHTYSAIRSVRIDRLIRTGLTVYPNPASKYLMVDCDEIEAESIRVYNSVGREVTADVAISQIASGRFRIDISALALGYYVLATSRNATEFFVH